MKERTISVAKCYGIYDRLKKLETQLLEDVYHVENVEFDVDGWQDDIRQVIILAKYNIPVETPNYFGVRSEMLKQILQIAASFGLKSSGDRIEDYGQHYYIVRDCDATWGLSQKKK